jgi:hypothetical protein
MDKVRPLIFTEDDHELNVRYSNRGEPFREGVEFSFDRRDGRTCPIWVLLDRHEVKQLRDKLNEFLGESLISDSPSDRSSRSAQT